MRNLNRLLSTLAAATLLLVACGGDNGSSSTGTTAEQASSEVVNRSASAYDTSCPDRGSQTFRGYIINGLPRDIALSVPRNSWNCDYWSGVSTPGGVFDGKTLVSGGRYPFRLEPSRHGNSNSSASFTVQLTGRWFENLTEVLIDGESELATKIYYGSYFGEDDGSAMPDSVAPKNQDQGEIWRGTPGCTFLPITSAPSSWRDTPTYQVVDAFAFARKTTSVYRTTMFIVDKGRIGLLFNDENMTADRDRRCGYIRPSGT
jgi:hypothetical protein